MTKARAMSRRKQEKPQPRKNLVIGEELTQDYLTCGVCQRDFPLCDIVRFIQHKVHSCSNKENNSNCLSKLFGYSPDDSESEDGTNQTSKEVCKKDAEEPEHKVVSSTINAPLKDNKATSPKEPDKPDKSDPCHYLCSTCKQPHPSALSLLQHAQNHHGLKIYVESSHVVNSNISPVKPSTEQIVPPQPAIRAPLLERQLDPTPLFPRSTSQELRLDLLGLSSTNSQLPSVDSSPPPLLEVHAVDMPLNAPPLAVTNEPLDFYSKRLRELAGATSPSALLSSQMKLLQPNFKAVVNNKPNIHPSNTNERSHQGTNCINNPSQLPQSSASSTTSENPPASPKTNSKSCEFCGKCFRFMSNLIVHRRSHTGEKPFKCHVCNHACTQASKLKRHMKTHKRKRKNSSSDRPLAFSESVAKNGIQSSDEASTIKNHEAQTNGESEYLSDDPNGVHHAEDEIEEDEDEEIDVEEEEVDEDDDDDDQTQPKLVVDHEQDEEDMVAQDLSKKPMKNGSSESNGIFKEERKGKGHKAIKHSLLSEVMENIGLASIQQYSEAYKQALKESSALKHDRHSDGSASNDGANHLERPSREGTRSAGQSPLGLNTGLLSAFDQTMGVKRIKLEDHWRDKDENSLYAGLWIPSSHSMSSYKDLYSSDGSDRRKSKNESALVCTSPSSVRSSSPRPGPSNSLCNLGSITNSLLKPKDQRRNDTCEYCGKVFKNCSNLTVHRRSHTGEKPYKCELCSYACAQSSKLTRHMKTHGRMGKDVYRCRFCDMPFSVPSTLEKHMRKCVVSQSTSSYRLAERESDSKEMIAYCPRDSDSKEMIAYCPRDSDC